MTDLSGTGVMDARIAAGRTLARAADAGLPHDLRRFLGTVAGSPEAGWPEIVRRMGSLVDGTCTNVAPPDSPWFECSECHGSVIVTNVTYEEPTTWQADGTGTVPTFCPVCGRRIVWDWDDE